MPSLTLKGLPEDLLVTLRQRAAENGRSMNKEAIVCLRLGLLRSQAQHPELIRRRLVALHEKQRREGMDLGDFDVVEFIRKDRESH
jgi:plasmid stability protein